MRAETLLRGGKFNPKNFTKEGNEFKARELPTTATLPSHLKRWCRRWFTTPLTSAVWVA